MAKKTLEEKLAKLAKQDQEDKIRADALANPPLKGITDQAGELADIFKNLELTDKATYDQLVKIVNEATNRNTTIANVVKRVKALGQAGARLATDISRLSGPGALAALSSALLGKKK